MILAELNETNIVERILALPIELQTLLDDPEFKSAINDIGSANGISADGLPVLEALVGVVVMGFLRPAALKGELIEMFGSDERTSVAIAESINTKLFLPLGDKLAKAYKPLPSTPQNATSPTLDLKSYSPLPAPAAFPSMAPPKNPPAPSTPTATPAPFMPPSPMPGATAPASTTPKPVPAPFMLQKEAKAEQAVTSSGFKLNLDPKIFGGGPSKPTSVPLPPRPAQLELSKNRITSPAANKFSGAPVAPRVVHYTDVKNTSGLPAAPVEIKAKLDLSGTVKLPVNPAAAAPAPAPTDNRQPITATTPTTPSFIKNAPGVLSGASAELRVPPPMPAASTPTDNRTPTTSPAPLPAPARVVNFTDGGEVK